LSKSARGGAKSQILRFRGKGRKTPTLPVAVKLPRGEREVRNRVSERGPWEVAKSRGFGFAVNFQGG